MDRSIKVSTIVQVSGRDNGLKLISRVIEGDLTLEYCESAGIARFRDEMHLPWLVLLLFFPFSLSDSPAPDLTIPQMFFFIGIAAVVEVILDLAWRFLSISQFSGFPYRSLPLVSMRFAGSHLAPRFRAHLPLFTVGAEPARVFDYAYRPHGHHFCSTALSMRNANFRVTHANPVAQASTSPFSTMTPFYDRVCSKVGMRKCGRIRSNIRDQSTGEGRRSSPCPSGVVLDGAQPYRVDNGVY